MKKIVIEISEKEDKLLEYISKIGGLSKEEVIRNLTIAVVTGLANILEAQLEKVSKILNVSPQELRSKILSLEEEKLIHQTSHDKLNELVKEVEEKGEVDFLDAVKRYGLDIVKQAIEERKVVKRGLKLLPVK
ncbi:MAG: hypothetical protein GXO26_04410 [Crenarchaeota archaeon]|nr:hypothetical protein [Thermoproteota archaeon]